MITGSATDGPAPLFSRARTKAGSCFLQCPPRRGGQSFLVATATPLNPFHDPVFLNFPVRLDALALSSINASIKPQVHRVTTNTQVLAFM